MDTVFDHFLSTVRIRVYTALEIEHSELFRLYAGQQTGPEPSWNICRTQAALVYAVPILYVFTCRSLSLGANVFVFFQSGHRLVHCRLPGKPHSLTVSLFSSLTMLPQLWLDIRVADSNKIVQRNFFSIRNISVSPEFVY
jgi:hypothetical protein